MKTLLFLLILSMLVGPFAKAQTADFDSNEVQSLYEQLEASRKKVEMTLVQVRATLIDSQARALLNRAQSRWLQWRDAECEFQSDFMRGGTGAGPLRAGCEIELNQRRVNELISVQGIGKSN